MSGDLAGPPTAATTSPDGRTTGARRLLSGGGLVTAGLGVFGLTTYAFLSLATRGMNQASFSAVATLWSLVYGLGAGLYAPLEQELTRAVAERRARLESIRPMVVRVLALGSALTGLVVAGLMALRDVLADRVLGGRPGLVGWLAVTLAVFAGLYVMRGVLAGTGRYWAYGGQLAAEGVVRLAAVTALVAASAATADRVAAVMALAPLVTLLATVPVLPRLRGTPRGATWGEATSNLGWLLLASLTWQGVANAGPVVLALINPSDKGLAGRFLAAFVIVRIPLFFTGALQASLLPHLVRAVERGDRKGFSRALVQVVGFVAALGGIGLLGLGTVGPRMLELLYGRGYSMGRVDLIALGLSSVLFLLAALLQSAVVATGGHRRVAGVFALTGVVFIGMCLLPLGPLPRLDLAYTVSAFLAAGGLALLLVAPRRDRGPEKTRSLAGGTTIS